MAEDDYGKVSREALARANEVTETAIFWGVIIAIVAIVIAMIKGIAG